MARPRVTVNCVADAHSGPHERIIEFTDPHLRTEDGGSVGGLIAFRRTDDARLRVEVYRCDGPVDVIPPPSVLWVCAVVHRHGDTVTIHRGEASAREALWDYVENNWDDELGEQLCDLDSFMDGAYIEGWATAPRRDHDEIIRWYFDMVDDESYTIREADLA